MTAKEILDIIRGAIRPYIIIKCLLGLVLPNIPIACYWAGVK